MASLSQFVVNHFGLLWSGSLILVAAVALWLAGGTAGGPGAMPSSQRRGLSALRRRDLLPIAAFIVAVGLYVFLIHKEDFADEDDEIFTSFLLRGGSYGRPIWPWMGRFFPLGHQEFNILRHLTRSPSAFQAIVAVQLVVLACVLLSLVADLAPRTRLAVVAMALITPSVLISFGGLVYPERNLLLWLTVLALGAREHSRSRSRWTLLGSLVASQIALYYKEPIFLLMLGFAGTRLLIGWRSRAAEGIRSVRGFVRAHALDVGILAQASTFVALYALVMYPNPSLGYATRMQVLAPRTIAETALMYLRVDLLLAIFSVVVVVRIVRIARGQEAADRLWDPLAVGAVLYALAYVRLRIFTGYYMAPVDVIALLCLSRWVTVDLRSGAAVRVAVGVCLCAVLSQDVAYAAYDIVERKSVVHAKAELAEFLSGYVRTRTGPLQLYFPDTNGYHLMEISSYLSYRGLCLAGAGSSSCQPTIEVASPRAFPSGRCVEWDPIPCVQAAAPTPGALVILLPDDDAAPGRMASLERNTLLYAYQPATVPQGVRRYLRHLHAVSPMFQEHLPPEHWLQLHVFVNP